VLLGAKLCETSLSLLAEIPVSSTSLTSILKVQMDNASRYNKNQLLFFFWSLLVAKGIFREVTMNFMLLGHTHNDIDALFGR
jgi:hypothetical protein